MTMWFIWIRNFELINEHSYCMKVVRAPFIAIPLIPTIAFRIMLKKIYVKNFSLEYWIFVNRQLTYYQTNLTFKDSSRNCISLHENQRSKLGGRIKTFYSKCQLWKSYTKGSTKFSSAKGLFFPILLILCFFMKKTIRIIEYKHLYSWSFGSKLFLWIFQK